MVQDTPIKKELVFLIDVKNKNLEYLLSKPVKEGNLQLESVENFQELNEQKPDDRVIAFIVGSDIQDPIQTAQRLHTYNKDATIIILTKPNRVESLKEAVKFSPFLGTEVFCLNESEETHLEKKLDDILKNSHQAAIHRKVIAESNSKLSLQASPQQSAFSQRFINKLMDLAPIGIAIVGSGQRILGWNKKAASIFEENEAQVLGKRLIELFSPEEAAKLEDYLGKGFNTQSPDSIEPLLLKKKANDSSTKFLSFTTSPFTYANGDKKALILAIKDVTERKQAQIELHQINETLEQRVQERTSSLLSYQKQLRSLAAQLSKAEEQERQRLATEIHDNLGQMLAVNKMKLDALPQEQLSGNIAEQIEEVKQGIDNSLQYARNLMSDLKPPPSLDKEDVTATLRWIAKKMVKRGLEVTIEDDGKPKRTSEEVRTTLLQSVREVLFNIIRHAEVDTAHFKMSSRGTHIQVIIEDKGVGFDPENTVSSTDNDGFGIFNIRERMDLIGGKVDIQSEPGKGTRVEFLAPLKEDTVASNDNQIQESSSEEYEQKIRVILVDDHQMVRRGLKKIVDAEDDLIVIAEASDGEEAVKLAREVSPHIIVMDVDMPRMNGIDATKEILSIMPNIRIIGLSLHDQAEVIESMRSAGATAYLSKNEAFETLCATIRSEAKMVD